MTGKLGKFVVEVKLDKYKGQLDGHEISIVREGHHGHKKSWGWADRDKIILDGEDEPTSKDIQEMKEIAEVVADFLNKRRGYT